MVPIRQKKRTFSSKRNSNAESQAGSPPFAFGVSWRILKETMRFARRYKFSSCTVQGQTWSWTWKKVKSNKINHFGLNLREWMWRSHGEDVQPYHVKWTMKFKEGSIMVRACMTRKGTGRLIEIKIAADFYTRFLRENLFGTMGTVKRSYLIYCLLTEQWSEAEYIINQNMAPRGRSKNVRRTFLICKL